MLLQLGTTLAFDEPWLRTIPSSRVQSLMVKDLINVHDGLWNEQMLRSIFENRDVEEILKIPLLNMHEPDSMLLRFDKRGAYIVKSAYRVGVDNLVNREDLKCPGEWSTMCSLHIPQKVRVFLWRLLRDYIPMRMCLRTKGRMPISVCVLQQWFRG